MDEVGYYDHQLDALTYLMAGNMFSTVLSAWVEDLSEREEYNEELIKEYEASKGL